MIDFILLIIIGSLWIWGIFALFDEGNLLWFIRERAEKDGAGYMIKPFVSCPYCMSSIHGFWISIAYYGFDQFYLIPIYMICLCGLNFIIKEYLYP